MPDPEYQRILNLYHNDSDTFWSLPQQTLEAFFVRLFSKV